MNYRVFPLLLVTFITANATSIIISTPQTSYNVRDSIPLSVAISNVVDLFAFQFDLVLDAGYLQAQSVSEQGYFLLNGVAFSGGSINNSGAAIYDIADSLSGTGPGFTGNTLLATVIFNALVPGTVSINPANVVLLDNNLANIKTNSSGATLNIVSSAVPEPSSLSLTTLACALCFSIYGCLARRTFLRPPPNSCSLTHFAGEHEGVNSPSDIDQASLRRTDSALG
jgi:hypothetical protein